MIRIALTLPAELVNEFDETCKKRVILLEQRVLKMLCGNLSNIKSEAICQ